MYYVLFACITFLLSGAIPHVTVMAKGDNMRGRTDAEKSTSILFPFVILTQTLVRNEQIRKQS